jgi:hypothetical protein
MIMEEKQPVKPVLPPMPPVKPITKPPYQPQPYPPKHQHRTFAVPCDPKMLHHMYRHMKMCHRYELQMLRMYMKWCKEQYKRRHHRPYNPCHQPHNPNNPYNPRYRESSSPYESSSIYSSDGGCC